MLNFSELPSDGVRFEQLARELILKAKLRPHWTGCGADSGRDLLAEEIIDGPLSSEKRTWLVDCKHFAASGRAVGVRDVPDIRDRCGRVGAAGFLLVTSTHPSAELMRKLSELNQSGFLRTSIWDAVEIERRLLTPTSYALAQQFFSEIADGEQWRIFYSEREQRWMGHYGGYFFYAESRAGLDPPPLRDMERIIFELEAVPVAQGENLRPRAIWHDTPNGAFYNCWADYLVPASLVPSLSRVGLLSCLRDDIHDGQFVNWDVTLQLVLPMSDYHDLDDPIFYGRFKEPLYHALYGSRPASDQSLGPGWWQVAPPPIRTFNDQAMWEGEKERHGFRDWCVMQPPYEVEL